MPRIELQTVIAASPEVCFDLSRDLDLHLRSMAGSGERAIAGRTTGLIGPGEQVTWEGRHFGVVHRHTSLITAFDRPTHFRDSMVWGRFASFEHDHYFGAFGSGTVMRDVLEFAAPLGPLGRIAEWLFLTKYLRSLLAERNETIKAEAERGGRANGPSTSEAAQ
jgi:ligand-binding SRPBCC domain-containing protein